MEYIHSSRGNHINEWCWMMLFFISRIFCKLVKSWKNIKRNYTQTKFLSSKSTINDFNHRNFDRVSEPLKFRRYLYFRQNVRSSNCPFGKMSVRQNVRSAKRPSAKCLSAKCHSAKCPFVKLSVRQNVRSAKRTFGKTSVGKMSFDKMSFGKMSGHRMQLYRENIRRISTFRAKVIRLKLGLRSKRRNSPYIFQVVTLVT
jgi:hypothetical protein